MIEKELVTSQVFVLQEEVLHLLKIELPFVTKYKLTELATELDKILEPVRKIKDELIKKLGTPKEDNASMIHIPTMINVEGENKVNPNFAEFSKELSPILEQKQTIKFKEIKLSEFNAVNTNLNFPFIFTILTED